MTESVGSPTAPTPIILASHADGSNFGIHGAELLVGAASTAGAEGSTTGADEGSSATSGRLGSASIAVVEVGLAGWGPRTVVSVVFENARSLLASFGK